MNTQTQKNACAAITVILAGVLLPGAAVFASPDPLPTKAEHPQTEIHITGNIDAGMEKKVHGIVIQGKIHTIRITSFSGNTASALAIARDVARNNMTVIVDGGCAGPCANYIFLAAAIRQVQPKAIVVFTASITAQLAMMPAEKTTTLADDYFQLADEEKSLMADMRLKESLLLEPMARLEAQCAAPLPRANTIGKSDIGFISTYKGWVPSHAYLAKAGVKVTGYWPATITEFQTTLKNAVPKDTKGQFVLMGPDAPSPPSQLRQQLKSVKACDAGQMKLMQGQAPTKPRKS